MKLGSVVMVVACCAAAIGSGCSHEARPAAPPSEPPPLPPSAGTPIGHLVDNAAELELSDDQLRKIGVINDELAVQLAGDDSELHPERAAPPADGQKQRGLGFRASGRTSGGAGGGAKGFPGGRTAADAGDGSTSREVVIPAATVNQVHQQRARHVREAIRRALELLDAGQQAIAKRLLTDHGVNLDTGEIGGDPRSATDPPTPGR